MTDKTSSSLQSTSPASSRTSSPSVSSQSSSASSQTSSPESESSTSGKSSLSVHSIKLLPCRLCGRRASGFHYGVNTCEACKVFFRRGLQLSKTYICKNRGRCWDTVGRKKCTACRYKKCVDIGMSKAAIKTGRYSHQKRTKVILEVQELERSRGISQDPQAPAPKATSTDQPLDLIPDPEYMTEGTEMGSGCDIDTLTGSDIAAILDTTRDSGTLPESGMSDPAMVIGSQIVLGSNVVDGLETVFESKMETGSDSEFDVMHGSDIVAELDKIISDDMMPGLSIPASNTRLSPLGSTSEILSGLNPGTEILSGSELNIASGSNTVTRSVAVPSPTVSYGSNISTGNMITVVQKQDLISLAFSLASKALDWLITSNKVELDEFLQPEDRIPTSSQELVSKSISSTTRKSVVAKIPLMTPTTVTTEMEDFDTFVSFLVEEHKRTVISNTGMPPEYLLQQQRLHFEEFQQREEMYGPLSPLPYEDYIDFLEKTGIEIDNRSELMNYFVPWMEFSMRT